jgi:hypothetical protein
MIEVNTESKTVIVETKERAQEMICATAYYHQMTLKELKGFDGIQKLANHFDIDTDDIEVLENENEADREQGFCNLYKFKK